MFRSRPRDAEAALKGAVERLHGGTAHFLQAVPVTERFEGQPVWEGVVHVFDLSGHPTATRAYAWAEPAQRFGRRQRFIAVLHHGPVDSPTAAVKAFVVEDYRQHGGSRG